MNNMVTRESDIEKYLVKRVDKIRGQTRKLKWIGRDHAPDRVVFFRGVWFIELKRPGATARLGQMREHMRLSYHGANIRVIDTFDLVDEFINEICS